MNAEDLFSQFFGGGFFGGSSRGQQRPTGPRKGKDVQHAIKVSLEDLYNGKTTKLSLRKSVLCSKCEGKGGKDGAVRECTNCHGTGRKTILRQTGIMIQQIESICNECQGEGEIINSKDRCKTCNGKKILEEKKVLEVFIEKGMKHGQEIRFPGEGDQGPKIIPGDVIIVLEEREHDLFLRKGSDLYYKAKIDLLTALAGGSFYVEHLDNRYLHVQILPGEVIRPGMEKQITGEGMPEYKRPFDKGNLYVSFEVEFPPNNFTTPENLKKLESILPPRMARTAPHGMTHVDEAVLSDIDPRRQSQKTRNAYEEDQYETGAPGGHPGVQCAQQ